MTRTITLFSHTTLFRTAIIREVIVKTVFNHRPYRDLCIGKQRFDGISQQMRGGMAYKIKPVGVFGGNDDQRRIAVDQKTCVDQPRGLAVERDAPAARDARQPRANRLRNVVDRSEEHTSELP